MGLVVVGYITAVLIPIVGFILGIVAVTRKDRRTTRHGVWIIVTSIVIGILWMVLMVAAAGSTHVNVTCSTTGDVTNISTTCNGN